MEKVFCGFVYLICVPIRDFVANLLPEACSNVFSDLLKRRGNSKQVLNLSKCLIFIEKIIMFRITALVPSFLGGKTKSNFTFHIFDPILNNYLIIRFVSKRFLVPPSMYIKTSLQEEHKTTFK